MSHIIKFFLSLNTIAFNSFLSIKMLWVRTFFTDLEMVPPDGHVVSENLWRNFLLHDFYEPVFT
jgi:hypothetical protein